MAGSAWDEKTADDGVIQGIDLTDDWYHVEQNLVRNAYTVTDRNGDEVLSTKQRLFKLKEEFPFKDADGNDVFHVQAESILDVAGDYTITDAATGATVAVLDKQFTLFHHAWKIRDPEGEVVAEIESESKALDFLRHMVSIFYFLPYTYEITAPDGSPIGTIEEHFSFRDKYDVEITDSGDVPKEAIVAAAICVDALENR